MEKVSFTAAYGGERMQAYLFLPKRARKPYQAVVFWPGAGAEMVASSERGRGLLYRSTFDFVVRDGRAVIYPVLKGTYERGGGKAGAADYFANLDEKFANSSDMHVMDAKDVSRSIDYLESRDDIDRDRIAFMGYSWGAMMGSLPCACEKRVKTGILLSGAMAFPLVAGWAARVTIPMLMINGRFDYLGFERTQLPLFRAFATPAQHKRQLVYETDHGLSGFEKEVVAGSLGWLDTYLGPVAR